MRHRHKNTSTSLDISSVAVDIVVPVYNGERFIIEALESVRNQTHQNFFCYIVDDGSTDSTSALLKEYLSLHNDGRFIALYQKNSGQARARNVGMKSGKSDYIFFLDADDTYGQNHLEASITLLGREKGLGGTYTRFLLHPDSVDNRKSPHQNNYYYNKITTPPESISTATDILKYHPFITSPTVLSIRRSVLEKIGYFDENLRGPEDTDFLMRICTKYTLGFVPGGLVYIRIHAQSFTLRRGIFKNYLALAEKHRVLLSSSPSHARLIGNFIASTLVESPKITLTNYQEYRRVSPQQVHAILFPGFCSLEFYMIRAFIKNKVSPNLNVRYCIIFLKNHLPPFLYVSLRSVWRKCRSKSST
jgi:glycosyltransferase involved in cell wall biosynthesis